jgi:hypothetical protein
MNEHQLALKIKMSKQYHKTKLKLAKANFISIMQTEPSETDMAILRNQYLPEFFNEFDKWIKAVERYYESLKDSKGGQANAG